MLLLTSEASPSNFLLAVIIHERGCKNVDWLQQAASSYSPYRKTESRWRTPVHVVLDGFFFFFFPAHLFPWLLQKYFWPCFFFFLLKARVGKGVLVWSHEEERWRRQQEEEEVVDSLVNIPDYAAFEASECLSWSLLKPLDTVTGWPQGRSVRRGAGGLFLESCAWSIDASIHSFNGISPR